MVNMDGPIDFPRITGIFAATCVFQGITGLILAWSVVRGRGFKGKPWGPGGPPEANFIGVGVCFISTVLYVLKALDASRKGTAFISFNKYWYSDYMMTCPLIVADICWALDLPYKFMKILVTLVVLGMGVLTFTEEMPDRLIIFLVGTFYFIIFFYIITRNIFKKWAIFPPKGKPFLTAGLFIFFVMWPLFPTLWIFSWSGLNMINAEAYYIIHAFLDIVCKTFFSYFMLLFRLTCEDWEIANQKSLFSIENITQVMTGSVSKKQAKAKGGDGDRRSSDIPLQRHIERLETYAARPQYATVAARHEMFTGLQEYLMASLALLKEASHNQQELGSPSNAESMQASRNHSPRATTAPGTSLDMLSLAVEQNSTSPRPKPRPSLFASDDHLDASL
eukprot:GILI01001652.1.p1 GENE.GILI01001652.1~~GILI01001652.1.p1  ORF type:complete len:392 (-),score=112.23 GILI01001652.1:471-1646(-)